MTSDKDLTAYESGKKGGLKTLEKYGIEHFRNLTKKRFEGMSKEQIKEYMTKVSHSRITKAQRKAAREEKAAQASQ